MTLEPTLAMVAKTFARDARVAPMNATSLCVDRKVFAMLSAGWLVVKLPAARVAALIADGTARRWDPNGRAMKEWAALGSQEDWIALAKEARAFAGGDK